VSRGEGGDFGSWVRISAEGIVEVNERSWNPGRRIPIAIENDFTVISFTVVGLEADGKGKECEHSQ
jgi:hypothetical protein